MLIPKFDVCQNDEFIFLDIQAPYTKVGEVEIDITETSLIFCAKPYFLR